MASCVVLNSLTKFYGANAAVQDLSLEVARGEVFGLLGPNGAGKSTTLHMLSGLVRPSSGTVTIFGKNLQRQFLEVAPRMGVLMEQPAFYNQLTVGKNLQILARTSRKAVNLDRILNRLNLMHVAGKRVGTLSQGMRQRLGLAQAMMGEPELLILDEPTSALDVEHAYEVLSFLRQLANDAGVTIIVSTHLMHEVETLCDRVAVIKQGRLVRCERTDSLLSYDQSSIEVLTDTPDAVVRHLAGQPWVEKATARPGRVLVQLTEPNPHQLTSFLVANGIRVSGIIPRRRTLQEYFLKALNA